MTTFVILLAPAEPTCPQERPSSHRDVSADYAELGVTIGEGTRGLRLLEVEEQHARRVADLLEIDAECFSYVRVGHHVADMAAAERYLLGERRGR